MCIRDSGDYWVVGPVVITDISPNSVVMDMSGSVSTPGRIINGSMINPLPENGRTQGYDSFMYVWHGGTLRGYPQGTNYDESMNVARSGGNPISAEVPLNVPVSSSLISTIAEIPTIRESLKTATVLTVVASAPAPGSFRPPYSGTDKTINFNVSTLSEVGKGYDLLETLPLVGELPNPSVEILESRFSHVWLDHIPGFGARYCHPTDNMQDYSRDISRDVSNVALYLNLDLTDETKEILLIGMVQLGIDNYRNIELGLDIDTGNWIPNEGQNMGRKLPIVFAGRMLGGTIGAYSTRADKMLNIPVWDPEIEVGNFNPVFQEDLQYWVVTYEDTQRVVVGTNTNPDLEQYSAEHIGLPEWGTRHLGPVANITKDDASWEANYRDICGIGMTGTALAVHIMGLEEAWGNDVFLDYHDRWWEHTGWDSSSLGTFIKTMWNNYRADYPPIWPNQSGNQRPTANAGSNRTITDDDGDGIEQVSLDGSASTDNDGDIVSWVWTDNLGDPIPDGQVVAAVLSVGEHIVTLTVTDDAGASDTDTVAISIENSGEPADPDDGLVYSKTDASSFNGVDSFVQIPTSGMSVDGGTIALSAYAEDLSVSRYLFGHTVGSWSNRIQLYIRDGNLGLGLGDTNSRHTSIASIQTKRWYHIALSWNGTEYTVYVDGSESATGSYSGLTELNTFADIGNTGNPSFRDQEAFYGSIKDVRIYNRALTDTEIQQLYNNGSGDPTHSVTASAQTGGSITPNGTLQLAEGVDQTFTITPQTGYHIADVLVDGSSAGAVASYTFANITGDHTITATFSLDTYTIAATAQAGATVSPGGNIEVQHGSSRTFTITAQTGYHITDVIVNGQSMGVIGSYTFTNITQSHTLAANAAANPGPVAWWKLDTYSGLNSPDSSENDNTATLANGPSWTGAGELKLDGVDDYVDCGSGASLNLTGDLTVTAWVYPESFGGNGFGRIVDKGDAGSGFAFYVREGAGSIAYLTYGGDFVVSGSGVIDLAKWQHVAVTYSDASDTVTFYVNGLPAGGGNYQTNPNDSADQPLIIGNRAALDRGFDGMLSNVRIYSRTLAADEISAIYRTHEVAEARNLAFELSTADSDDYVVQEGNLPLPAGATFTDNIFTWRTWYNQAGNYEITFEVPGRPDLTQSVPMTVENVSLKPWYQDFLEANSKY